MCDFQVGEEVICVDDSPVAAPYIDESGERLILNKTYIILETMWCRARVPDESAGPLVRVEAVAFWRAERFRRPVIDETPVEASELLCA